VWFWNSVVWCLYSVVWKQCLLVVRLCGFGTVLFGGYIVWFLEQCCSVVILCGLGTVLVSGYIVWLRVIRNWKKLHNV
jgi:hypothetical protein